MKVGKRVWYVRRGEHTEAVVTAIAGMGASGYKLLKLEGVKRPVWHRHDAPRDEYWLESGEHAADAEQNDNVPAPVVPRASAVGRATAGVGSGRGKDR